ncbi:hypothetical protein CRUP_003918 [Coryphaenoides rupestris]|nr:hypothetical protein CRUP_003918 [Coryphaenoides rupestris]
MTPGRTDTIMRAMELVAEGTCLSFHKQTTEADYLCFHPSKSCASLVGFHGGEQVVLIGPTCAAGNVAHELLHGLGFYHEHTRQDRGQYINIFDENIMEAGRTRAIMRAMELVSVRTCLSFHNRTTEADYLYFHPSRSCASFVGFRGGAQLLYVGPMCSIGNIAHELFHALGFHHEHTREDRDQYINIMDNNIMMGSFTIGSFARRSQSGRPLLERRSTIGAPSIAPAVPSAAERVPCTRTPLLGWPCRAVAVWPRRVAAKPLPWLREPCLAATLRLPSRSRCRWPRAVASPRSLACAASRAVPRADAVARSRAVPAVACRPRAVPPWPTSRAPVSRDAVRTCARPCARGRSRALVGPRVRRSAVAPVAAKPCGQCRERARCREPCCRGREPCAAGASVAPSRRGRAPLSL